jgi:hypothetical protein
MNSFNALASFAIVACLAAPAAAQTAATPPPAANVLGSWEGTVTPQQGDAIPVQLKLKKDGEKIIGTISSPLGEAPVEAEVKGKALIITFIFQGQNGPMSIELDGTVDGDAVKGTMAVDRQPGGEWTVAKSKEPVPATPSTSTSTSSTNSSPAPASLTGTWNLTVELPNMTATPTLVLKQDGEKLTGDYVSAQYGKFPVTGTIKGSDVTFWFAMSVEGNALNVTYTGTVEKDGSMKGSVNYGDAMSGTFVGSVKK